jgi:hypothetical protein
MDESSSCQTPVKESTPRDHQFGEGIGKEEPEFGAGAQAHVPEWWDVPRVEVAIPKDSQVEGDSLRGVLGLSPERVAKQCQAKDVLVVVPPNGVLLRIQAVHLKADRPAVLLHQRIVGTSIAGANVRRTRGMPMAYDNDCAEEIS